jgi:hypothetical protein
LLLATIVAFTFLMVNFPPELADRFIDVLAEDKPALMTCGLVCRQWYPRSRVHLFFEVKLQLGQSLFRRQVLQDTADRFFVLADASFLDILATIRRLTLAYGPGGSSVAKAHLLRFAPCSKLTDLSITLPIRSFEMCTPLITQLAVVGPRFSCLSNFSFDFYACSMDELLNLLPCLPTIQNLSVRGFEVYALESPPPLPSFPHYIRCLTVGVCRGGGLFIKHLLSLSPVPQLRSLTFDMEMFPEEQTKMALYLQLTAPALQSLSIDLSLPVGEHNCAAFLGKSLDCHVFRHQPMVSDPFMKGDFQCCTGLLHLSLNIPDMCHPPF